MKHDPTLDELEQGANAPHFEGHTPDHVGTPPGHEAAQSPDGDDPDLAGRAPGTTSDHAQHVPSPVSTDGTVHEPRTVEDWEARLSAFGSRFADHERVEGDDYGHAVWFKMHTARRELAERLALTTALADSLLAVEWAGTGEDADGDLIDCCPNCIAPIGDAEIEGSGVHYAHCELRDALDAALGVKSERVVHPAHAAREAARG